MHHLLAVLRRHMSSYRSKKDIIIHLEGDLIYGIHPVYLALKANTRKIHKIFYNKGSAKAEEIAELAAEKNIPCHNLSRPNLDELTRQIARYKDHHVHQGLAADVSKMYHIPVDYKVPQIPGLEYNYCKNLENSRLVLLLYNIKDPMNLGALLRSAFYFGVDSIIVAGNRTDLTSVVSKASSGAMELLPIYAVRNVETFLAELQEKDWNILALSLPSDSLKIHVPVSQVELRRVHNLVVVGSEGDGIPESVLQLVNKGVYIDSSLQCSSQYDSTNQNLGLYIDSLNVSVATGIVLHALALNGSGNS